MSRYFEKITVQEFKNKLGLEKAKENPDFSFQDFLFNINNKIEDDFKVQVDWENYEYEADEKYPHYLNNLLGTRQLENGMVYHGFTCGGDWETSVFGCIYYSGKEFRVYIPKDGNPWNTDTNAAYGNDEEADSANIKKRFKDRFEEDDEIDDFSGLGLEDENLIKKDISERIQLKGSAPVKQAPVKKEKKVNEPVENPSDTKKIKDEIVRQTCEHYGVEYSHYDWFKQPYNSGCADLLNAACIVYPGPYKPWVLAINFDGTVVRPGDSIVAKANQLVISIITILDQ